MSAWLAHWAEPCRSSAFAESRLARRRFMPYTKKTVRVAPAITISAPESNGRRIPGSAELLCRKTHGAHLSGLLPREPPVDLRPLLVGPTVPSLGFPLQLCQIGNPARAQTLPREQQAEFDFRLIEPASVFWGVVHGEPVPNVSALLVAEVIGQRASWNYALTVAHWSPTFSSLGRVKLFIIISLIGGICLGRLLRLPRVTPTFFRN
jgi:hypothetical protein